MKKTTYVILVEKGGVAVSDPQFRFAPFFEISDAEWFLFNTADRKSVV